MYRGIESGLGAEPDLDEILAMRREWTKRSLEPRPDTVETLAELRAFPAVLATANGSADVWRQGADRLNGIVRELDELAAQQQLQT